jgi:hypothetical protein
MRINAALMRHTSLAKGTEVSRIDPFPGSLPVYGCCYL